MTALPVKRYSAPATCTILLSTWCKPSCMFGRDDSVHCILWGFMMLVGFSAEPSVCWAADRVRAWLVLCGDAVSNRRPGHSSPGASAAPAARSCQPATRRGICSCSAKRHSLSCHWGAVTQQQTQVLLFSLLYTLPSLKATAPTLQTLQSTSTVPLRLNIQMEALRANSLCTVR